MARRFNIAVFLSAIFLLSLSACGGSSDTSSLDPQNGASASESPPDSHVSQYDTEWKNLLNSKNYSGMMAVMFKPETSMRLINGAFLSSASTTSMDSGFRRNDMGRNDIGEKVNQIIMTHGGKASRGLSVSDETIAKALQRAEGEGKSLHDWRLYYTIEIKSPGHAEEFYKEMSGLSDIVEWIHPIPVPQISDVGDTGDVTGGSPTGGLTEQLYLDTEAATGGINAYAAWNAGITGQGVRIADEEYNWNFTHEDLSISSADVLTEATSFPENIDVNDLSIINHGTAAVGMLAANGNNNIKGISYSSTIKLFQTGAGTDEPISSVTSLLEEYANGQQLSDPLWIRPGDIVVIEVQSPSQINPDAGCTVNMQTQQPTYCLPIEAYPYDFAAIQDATAMGVIVVEGGGNGGTDLGNPSVRVTGCGASACPNLATDDSGAIMVAASNGQKNKDKPWWSNWGTRINAFGWGYDVATTGYGDHPASNPANQNEWYTKNFNGASSAAAMVAGAVALVQSYTKEFYKDIVPHKEVYLDAAQMRTLLEQTGTASTTPVNVNIGKKPNVGAMMALVASGAVLPHVTPNTEALLPKYHAVAGVRYDIDADGRDDLIAWDNGTWKIDLSSVAPSGANPPADNFGEWDMNIAIPAQQANGIYWPVVHDYDSDGRADLALYDSKNGLWYIKYMTPAVIASPSGEAIQLQWDRIIDFTPDPAWKPFSRAILGDYNGDNYLDLAVVTADGHWIIDYGGIGHIEKQGSSIVYVDDFGTFEKDVKFLTDTQLAAAPGWAYLPAAIEYSDNTGTDAIQYEMTYKSPDGVTNAQKMYIRQWDFTALYKTASYYQYGANDVVMVPYNTGLAASTALWLYTYGGGDEWANTNNRFYYLVDVPSPGWSGSPDCFPVPGDFDGDGTSDFALKCPNNWKIAYYNRQGMPPVFTLRDTRVINLNNGTMSLPPTVFPGGMKYQDIKSILDFYGLFNSYQDKDPFTPYTIQCINDWAVPPKYCLAQ